MDFFAAKEYFLQLNKFGSVLGLDSIKELLKRFGNPEKSLKVIHVAGTNGKGSTIAFIESILVNAGFKVGVYTSPVVFDYLEKIKINGQFISEDEFAVEAEIIKAACDSMVADGLNNPTVFESETAMAFNYFAGKNCDIVIIETGMGGATDATNVCEKILCGVLTSISMDHTAFLGETLEEIAKVKAGIIKENCPVVLMKQGSIVLDTVAKIAGEKHAGLKVTGEKSDIKADLDGTSFDYTSVTKGIHYENVRINMLGSYQPDNAAVAIEVAEILSENGYNIDKSDILTGLKKAYWRGRFEKLSDNPLMVIDGAHNPGASLRLHESIEMYFNNHKKIYIMGVLADKDFAAITRDVLKDGEMIFTITPHNTRGLAGESLAESISEFNENVVFVEEYAEAVKKAVEVYEKYESKGYKPVIIAFGSLSYLGELKEAVKEIISDDYR